MTAVDEVSGGTEQEGAREELEAVEGDEVGVAELVARNRARLRAEREAPVHVIASRDPRQAGRRICEAVVPRRPPETPVLLKPNLSGIDQMRNGIDDGVALRTTGIEFVRGVVQCLKARGHREITIAEIWSREEQRERWLRVTGLDRLIAEEGVAFVGVFDDRGPDGTEPPVLAAPHPGGVRIGDELMVPRVLARHLRDGLYITIPRLKMHRYAVTTLSIKNAMGMVVMRGATPPRSNAGGMHREINAWLHRFREEGVDDRDAYIASLERFAERIVDVLEIELPDAALIDGVPPVAGDGFALIEPLDEGWAIGSTNPILADAVGAEILGYLDNADLEREIRHRMSPLLEEAARRFYGSTEVLRGVRIVGDDSFRGRSVVAHYRAFPGFEIGRPPRPMGALPWLARAVTAHRAAEPPAIDGSLDDAAWRDATEVHLDRDWRGEPTGPETIARALWTPDALYLAFDCAYDALVVDDAAPVETEHETLYRFDAVEVFVDPAPRSPGTYVELEIGPRGHFLDIDVDRDRRPRGDVAWSSGLERATRVDEATKRYVVEARVPAAAFGSASLRPGEMRIALYRLAGTGEHRTHLARFPTYTERPNFHVPERFGWLRLVEND